MDIENAVANFAALSQTTRLKTLRLLVREEPHGLAAGEIARRLAVPHNTLSTHLGILAQAGWVLPRRESRSIIYRANLAQVNETIRFLIHDCCASHPDVCDPLAALPDGVAADVTDCNPESTS